MTTMAGTAAWPRQARGVPCMATRQMEARKEAEHKRFLETRHQEEERRARHNLRRRAIKKRELMETFRRRRLQNFCSEAQVTGTMRARPQPPPSVRNPHHHRDRDHPADPPKERTFCKRNGFIWSDLERTPKARLSLVVPPIAVKRDRECLERLLSTVDKEELEAREGARRQRERIAAQHDKLQLLASPRKARQAQIMAAITKKSDTKTAHNVSSELCRSGNQPNQDTAVLPAGEKDMKRTGRVMSRRQEQLAQPREPADLKTAYIMLGSTDLTGLLHTEPAMRGVLQGHLDDLRQNLTAARFLKHTGPTQTQTVVPQIELAAAAASIGGGGGGGGGGGRGGGGGGGEGCGRSGVSEKNPHHHRHNNKEPHVMARAGRAAGWPYNSVTVEGVASVEFDPRATLGDEESLSAA